MSEFEERYDQIESYLKNQLTEEEHQAFEDEMSRNAALKEEVDVQRLSLEVLEHAYLLDMSRLVKDQIAQKKPGNLWKWILGVSTICAGVAFIALHPLGNTDETVYTNETISIDDKQAVKDIILDDSSLSVLSPDNALDQPEKKVISRDQPNDQKEPSIQGVSMIEDQNYVPQLVGTIVEENEKGERIDSPEDNDEKKAMTHPTTIVEKAECKQPDLDEVKVVNTHLNEVDGALELDLSKGILYSINGREFSDLPDVEYLEKGEYHVVAKSSDECTFDLGTFEVLESPCLNKTEFVFNIANDGVLVIDIQESDNSSVMILNRIGENVFEKELNFETEFEWDGFYSNGNEANVGIHKLVLKTGVKEPCIYNVVIAK